MTREALIKRLEQRRSIQALYVRLENGRELQGRVGIDAEDNSFVLIWEECPSGQQFNENMYTRDEFLRFESLEPLMQFLDESGLNLDLFRPN